MKTGLGETAHDIAVRMGRSANIMSLLEEPDVVMENMEVIETVEEAVHSIIQERAGDRLRATGAQLPQLAVLWEMSNECGEQTLGLDADWCLLRASRIQKYRINGH